MTVWLMMHGSRVEFELMSLAVQPWTEECDASVAPVVMATGGSR